MSQARGRTARARRGLVHAALLLLVCAGGCRGVGGASDRWPGDAGWIGDGPSSTIEWTPTPTNPQVSTDSSPVSAILSRLIPGDDAPDRARRVRFEPVPIVGERDIGLSFTVRW